jgi:hypothetical protein
MTFAKPLGKILRVVATLIVVLFGIMIAFRLVWLAVNLSDERLTPAAAALLASHPDLLPDSDNIFVAFVGYDAPSGQSMMATGEARIEAYNRARDRIALDPAAAATYDGSSQGTELTFKGSMSSWQPLTSSIWSTAKGHRAEVASLLAANRELYQRYLSLQELRSYFDSAQPSANAPFAYVPNDVHELFLADVATRLQTGTSSQREAALTDLQRDMRMWKTVLDGYGELFSKVMAAVSLHEDLLLLGDMVTDPDFDPAPFGERWLTLLTPFDLKDWKIGAAYPWQMRVEASLLQASARADISILPPDARPAPWWRRVEEKMSAQLFKLNATENLQAQRIERLRALADGDPGTFTERRDAYRVWERRRFPATSWPWPGWYNPIGRVLLGTAPLDDDYPARVFDVAALQRLVFLAYQVRLRCLQSKDVATFMKQHPEWATHPIDAKPFSWDPASGELGVLPVGPNSQKARFSLMRVGFSHCPRN